MLMIYDGKSRTLYFEIHRGVVHRTEELEDGKLLFDLDKNGRVLGYEFVLGDPQSTVEPELPESSESEVALQSL